MARASSNLGNVDVDMTLNDADQSISARYSAPVDTSKKLWVPTIECQFKCCQDCRQSSRDRSFMSLNAVANGEYQPTAVSGFGFHLQGKRPVSRASIVRTIGLRPSPGSKNTHPNPSERRRPARNSSHERTHSAAPRSTGASPFNDDQNADTTFSQPTVANFYDSTAMTRSLNDEASRSRSSSIGTSAQVVVQTIKNVFLGKKRDSMNGKKDDKSPKKEQTSSPVGKTSTPRRHSALIDAPPSKTESVRPGIGRSHKGYDYFFP